MKIVVTGSSGFVGSYLVKKLIEIGEDVTCLDIRNGIDVTNWEQVKDIGKFDLLIHLAAKSYVPDSYKFPRDFYYTNIIGTLNVLELCRIHGAKMIFTSSYIYGNPQYLPIDEKHPISAFNPYSQTKIIGEELCKGYHRDFGMPIVILRPFNVYGIGQNENFLVPSIIKQSKSGKILLRDPNPSRDMVFIDDMVEAYIKAIRCRQISFEVFNIGSGVSFSVKEIAEMIASNFLKNITIRFTGERRENDIMVTVADISKAKDRLAWKPLTDLGTGIRKMINK